MSLPTRPLGRTGLPVTKIGFGGAVIGIANYLTAHSRDEAEYRAGAVAAVEAALGEGVTLFDTAPGYGFGRSESLLGQVLEPHRERIVLTSKVKVTPGDRPEDWDESLRASLERLRTDRLDLLQLHGNTWPDDLAAWALDGPAAWLADVKRRGLACHVGITAETPSGGLERLLREGPFDVLQIAYSVIYQGACDYQREPFGPIPLARSLGLGVLTMRTMTSNVLTKLLHSEFPELDPARIGRLALKFALSTPEVDTALVGMATPDEVRRNCALARDTADRLDLRQLHDFFDGRPRQRPPASPGEA